MGAGQIKSGVHTDAYSVEVSGRFLKVTLLKPHLTLSTSEVNGGFNSSITHIINHQSCEGNNHQRMFEKITSLGHEGYHLSVCKQIKVAADKTALLGTAANMSNLGHSSRAFGDLKVLCLATAGVRGNPAKAGDPASWDEIEGKGQDLKHLGGTINIIALINKTLTQSAMVKAAMMATEAKGAALTELGVGSKQSPGLATGTSTDQLAIACLSGTDKRRWCGHHTKLGELLGSAVKRAVLESLKWQNGLEPSSTNNLEHILGRFGYTEKSIANKIKQFLSKESWGLFLDNIKAVCFNARVATSALAIAAILDKKQFKGLPTRCWDEALLHQCALMATYVAEDVNKFGDFLEALKQSSKEDVIIKALSLGWRAKWD